MKKPAMITVFLSPLLLAASCGTSSSGDSASSSAAPGVAPAAFDGTFKTETLGTFDQPWAGEFVPGTSIIMVTEKPGTIQAIDTASGRSLAVTGAPQVAYGGQGGLGDIAFLAGQASGDVSARPIYLSWAEAGEDDTRGAVVGQGTLNCDATSCAIEGLSKIWSQAPKTTGRGHYSHRIVFSQDEQQIFIASGDRQKLEPAQDNSNTMGTIVRLDMDGSPAADNPFAGSNTSAGSVTDEIYSYGHRNILGMAYDADGQLWEIEHGPAGGDELNLVEKGANYGWPTRSNGDHYSGEDIPDHTADDGFTKPALDWTPVIAPGDMIAYQGDMFPDMKGDLLIAGLQSKGLVRVAVDGTSAREVARYDLGKRIRSVFEGPDGAIYVLEDGEGGRLLKLTAG
jgi:glucose/arabinose dehydrogenase